MTDAERIAELERQLAESERQRAAMEEALREQLQFVRKLPHNGILGDLIRNARKNCEDALSGPSALEAHDEQVRRETLEEAAEAALKLQSQPLSWQPVAEWLRARAARKEAGRG